MSKLYIVATPIGNLEDITFRAIRILKEVDIVLCEDTRVTGRLLNHYDIHTKTLSYHQHSNLKKADYILDLLKKGKNLALVSDSGTPAILDPGGKLVGEVVENLGEDVTIESVPGPSALTTALSISGLSVNKFTFLGFPPHKKGRNKFLLRLMSSDLPVVIYESKHRILKLLREVKDIKENNPDTGFRSLDNLVVCRELSKMYEAVYRGSASDILKQIESKPGNQKGEFVIIFT